MIRQVLIALPALAVTFAAAQAEDLKTEQRSIGSFDKLDVRTAANVEIEIGKPASLEITARQDVISDITTEIEGGTLVIGQHWDWGAFAGPWGLDQDHDGAISRAEFESSAKANFDRADTNHDGKLTRDEIRGAYRYNRNDNKVTIHLTVPRLGAMNLGGAGQVTIKGFAGGDTSIVLAGAGSVKGSGELDALSVSLNGAGNVDLGSVHAKSANVRVNGTGSVAVDVSEAIDATVNGVGSISYSGAPAKVTTAVHGVGSIRRK